MIVKLTVHVTSAQFEMLQLMRRQHGAPVVQMGSDAEFAGVVLAAAIEDRFAIRSATTPSGEASSGDFADEDVISLAPSFAREPCIVI